ncbi:MAG: hypothetical protein H7Y17_06210 [Chlorobia bacterium]|nr:hypothetical protein [Fimbriimonadaceae bacterium]
MKITAWARVQRNIPIRTLVLGLQLSGGVDMNNWIKKLTTGLAIGSIALGIATPTMVEAQSLKDLDKLIGRRQDKKNEWRNIAYVAGGLGVLGLLKKDNTLFFAGAAGALYSAHRYEQDRKSQSKLNRTKAAYFSQTHFYRDGKKYVRKTTMKNGKKHYYFARA